MACVTGVAKMRAVGPGSVYAMTRGFIHGRAIAAARGLDLQCTLGNEEIVIGPRHDQVQAVILYAFTRPVDRPKWDEVPADGEASDR